MPAQISTILYLSGYKEKVSGAYFIGNATGHTRIDDGDKVQTFNITVFYPMDESKPCYLPKIKDGQVLSISNSKFSQGNNNELDLILSSASILNINPEQLPIHQITIVGVATATETPTITDVGVQLECTISDYISKEKPVEIQVTLFHPPGGRLTNQTSTVKRGSTIFFSGALTVIDDKLYVELHNFSFIRANQTFSPSASTKKMPWSSKSSTPDNPTTTTNIVQTIHNRKKSDNPPIPITVTPNSKSKKTSNHIIILDDQNLPPRPPTPEKFIPLSTTSTQKTPRTTRKNSQQLTPTTTKRNTRSSIRTNKKRKLSDIASEIIATAEDAETLKML
ncbi:hypothetical protein RhiirA5_380270 [Rhizophagus irregularis]|uniref:Uncharacterized protein n=1 Tax=Rhizophagus irregularis TaxID=588596 RepID=A0A2N0P8Z6_9GLOM|nr:hypothetical protein RhiirA5_380270 [Rhizophagus irregularis]